MTKNIFSFLCSVFQEPILQRLLVVLLLPNVLIIGFTVSEIDNNSNFLWRSLVGPYWYIEKLTIIILGVVVAGAALHDLLAFFKAILQLENERYLSENNYAITKTENNAKLKADNDAIDHADYLKMKSDEWEVHVARCEARKKAQRELEERVAIEKSKTTEQGKYDRPSDLNPIIVKSDALRDITGRGA